MNSKFKSVIILGVVLFVGSAFISGIIRGSSDEDTSPSNNSTTETKDSSTDPLPKIRFLSAKEVDGRFTITSKDETRTFTIITGDPYKKPAKPTKVLVNGVEAAPLNDFTYNYFTYASPLKLGENKFLITAENTAGKDTKELYVNYVPPVKTETKGYHLDDEVFEAGITCQIYAESKLLIKDINVHYDQSSIQRKNPDGTITIKAKIADSRGFLHSEKPLGIMECTTDGTGMEVKNFLHY